MTDVSPTERLVTKLATAVTRRRTSRRSFLAAATLGGAALAVNPVGYVTRPQSAYASVCGPDSSCGSGYTAFCCSINNGSNTCPPGTFAGGWWKADRSSFCGGAARYYIDCNARHGTNWKCHCHKGSCDRRYVACNIFRYGQCNTQIPGVTAVVCRQISCLPPWQLYPHHCGRSSATDNNTARHNAPCLTPGNTYRLRTYDPAPHALPWKHHLGPGRRLVAANRHTECVMRDNGDFVLHNERGVIWSTGTAHTARGGRLALRAFGELVVLDRHGKVQWTTGRTTRRRRTFLKLHNDGKLAIHHGKHIVWHTHTHTP